MPVSRHLILLSARNCTADRVDGRNPTSSTDYDISIMSGGGAIEIDTNHKNMNNCGGGSDLATGKIIKNNGLSNCMHPVNAMAGPSVVVGAAASSLNRNGIQDDVQKYQFRKLEMLKEKFKKYLQPNGGTLIGHHNEQQQQQWQRHQQQQQQMSTSWEFKKPDKPANLDIKTTNIIDDDGGKEDEQQDVAPPRFIKISDGKISLGPPKQQFCDKNKEKAILENRIFELEGALLRLQDQVNNSQCGSPKLEKDLKEQLENMNRAMKTKDRKAMQAYRDHKVLQARFVRQEIIVQSLQQENKNLHQRIRQYEHCLDDVMRKVVDAIVAEDSLREEVSMLKGRVRDLEAQNAALSTSPVKGKDEGYCTMSSGQPQPCNNHLEDLPEEPEQWLLPPEPCSTEMEDWSMSQEELGVITLDDENHENDWIWNSSGYLNSTMIDSQSEGISQLLRDTIVYSDDEEIACIDFTKDFYKLVNIPTTGSTRSLYSHMDAETDDEDDDDDDDDYDDSYHLPSNIKFCTKDSRKLKNDQTSPTPSEAGEALVTSCSSSSESDEQQQQQQQQQLEHNAVEIKSIDNNDDESKKLITAILRNEVQTMNNSSQTTTTTTTTTGLSQVWRKSNGWKRVAAPIKKNEEPNKKLLSPSRKSKIPPPVPVRRSYVS